MISCMIVDDEPLAREVLKAHLAQTPGLELVAVCSNAFEAFEALHRQAVDLIFLDIKMPGLSGLHFVRSLAHPPAVILTTAFHEFALEGFEIEAVDYLVKPITYKRFEKGIRRFLKIQHPEPVERKDYTYFKVSGQLVKVLHADLIYARSVKDYIQLHTTQGQLLVYMTMKYLAELLPAPQFVRVHRSYLVNRSFAERVDRHQIWVRGRGIPIGENYRHLLEEAKDW